MRNQGVGQNSSGRIGVLAMLVVVLVGSAEADPLPALRLAGADFVNERGEPVVLKGCNLGNWLLLEPWMLAQRDFADQHEIIIALQQRFGRQEAEMLLDTYRQNWITPRDLEIVRRFGFNLVRVPFHHSLLADEETPFELRDDSFEWLDRAVSLAEDAGVYVILDMHGAPGGQSVDMPSGRKGENRLWDDETCQRRMAWLWQRIAERYRDRTAVIAFDLLNEPWHDFNTVVGPQLAEIVDKLHSAIRAVDPDTLIFAPGALQGIRFYGDPRERGWTHVGFTEHYYPGLFGNGAPALATHENHLTKIFPACAAYVEPLNVPYLVGEFNVVFDTAMQPEMMRQYYDEFERHGWLATMWSLKIIHPEGGVAENNWYLATNAEPFTLPDLRTASADEIEAAFKELGTQKLAADEPLRSALTTPAFKMRAAPRPTQTIERHLPGGWESTDIGDPERGGAFESAAGDIVVLGRGSDLWGARDEFQFASQPADGDVDLVTWLTSFDTPHQYSKAGLMLRAGLAADDAHVLLHAFGDGRVVLAWRAAKGGPTRERVLAVVGFPIGLSLRRRAGAIHMRYGDVDGAWHDVAAPPIVALRDGGYLGYAVCSHAEHAPARATFASEQPLAEKSANAGTANLLRNASFEAAAGNQPDLANGWQRWGHWLNRETGWTPRRAGECVLAYHHWRVERADSSGWYQEVAGLPPEHTATFSVFANRDQPAADKHGPASIELRVESLVNGRMVHVASQTWDAGQIAADESWSKLSVTGPVPGDTARVLIVVSASKQTPRDAALKFDAAALQIVE